METVTVAASSRDWLVHNWQTDHLISYFLRSRASEPFHLDGLHPDADEIGIFDILNVGDGLHAKVFERVHVMLQVKFM
jgi:hypothetical protein